MKRIHPTIFGISFLSLSVAFGQANSRVPNAANMRAGESVEFCHQHTQHNQLMSNPAFAAQSQLDQQAMEQRLTQMLGEAPTRGTVYKIPIVFHVLHNGGTENISRDQILDALAILNRDFRLQNADAANVHFDFNANNPAAVCQPSDVEIEFVLATKAPDGACFSGITRTKSPLTNDGSDGDGQVDAIVAGNDVYQGEWPGNRYLNVFVCEDIGGAAGYTFTPSSWIGTNMRNGIWVKQNYTGSIGTSSVNASRTLTHEAGHWLNLSHTWGSTNDPLVSCGDDYVGDTPATRGTTTCNLNENFCGVRANVENYMDYAYCSKMFTEGQVARMRAALTGSTGGRNNLITNANLIATGTNSAPALCSAQFSVSQRDICAGQQVQFSDETYNAVTGWSWTFTGGTPATSTAQNPTVTYTTPGTYAVTLSATDGSSTDVETKMSYIVVLPASEPLPFHEGFENLSSLSNSTRWTVQNYENNAAWGITSSAARSGSKSAKLANYGQAAGMTDELSSAPVDLSGINATDGVTLSFRYAYRKRISANDDFLKVYITNTCGETWGLRKTMHGASLSNATAPTAWTPTAADWTTVHMMNITSVYWADNFRFKFRFEGDGGNNIYLDDINIYAGAPSETVVLGINDKSEFQHATVYPNPADEEVHVRFTASTGQSVGITVTDLMGHTLQQHKVNANEGENIVLIATDMLAPGMYMIRLNEGNQAMQFVVR